MKKRATLLFVCFAYALAGQNEAVVFYVAPTGKPTNPGTREHPFATPQQARDAIRKSKTRTPGQEYTVYFREGTYFLTEPLDLTAQDSGAIERPVRYAAYPGEKVLFHGGAYLHPERFTPTTDPAILRRLLPEARGRVLEIDLKKNGVSDFGTMKQRGFGPVPEPAPLELFINGERPPLARYPNEGKLLIGKVYDQGAVPQDGDSSNRGATFGYTYGRPARWMQARDIWLFGHFSWGYNDDNLGVAAIDTLNKTLTLANAHWYGVKTCIYPDTAYNPEKAALSVRGYVAYNLLEEIDQAGEWYLDRSNGKLYLWPPDGFSNARVECSIREKPFIQLLNTANITIENISFTTARGMGIFLENAHHINIDGCVFSNLGTVAISTGQPLQHTKQERWLDGSPEMNYWTSREFHHINIRHCEIFNTGSGGIILTGGNRQTLAPSENTVSHCTFYRNDLIYTTYSPAIEIFGVGTTITNCHFHDLKHQGVSLMGNDHRILNCLFERICTEADDMGAIYSGRDPSSRGTVIRHNHFRNILPPDKESQVAAVFLDDGLGGFDVSYNYFERCGSRGDQEMFGCVALHGGHDNNIHHNVFYNCEMAVGDHYWTEAEWKKWLESPIIQERARIIVDITSPVYQQRYPELKNYFTNFTHPPDKVEQNILINTNMMLHGNLELVRNHLLDPDKLQQALDKIGFKTNEIGPSGNN